MTRTAPAAPRPSTGILIAIAAVVVGVPLAIGAWIGILVLAEHGGIDVSPSQAFAWILAVLDAALLWPLALRGGRRLLWQRIEHPELPAEPWGRRPLPAVPRVPVSFAERALRAGILVLGGAALLAICGPQPITAAILGGLSAASVGPLSLWMLLRLSAFVIMAVLLLTALWATDRRVKGAASGTDEHLVQRVLQNWYTGAALGWTAALVVGFVLSWATLITL